MLIKKNLVYFLVLFFSLTAICFSQDSQDTNVFLDSTTPITKVTPVGPAQNYNQNLAQNYVDYTLKCPYAFERDIYLGKSGEDVRLLQKLLNSDNRTTIASSGPGSPGNESTNFGDSTKAAVKRFQALFIEYIGSANGRFGPRTRTVMSAICTSSKNTTETYTKVQPVQNQPTSGNVPTTVQTIVKNNEPVRVAMTANVNSVNRGTTFKVFVNASTEIKKFDGSSIILDGATISDVRKLGKGAYVMIVVPNEDAKTISLQIEAEKIEDLNGNRNQDSSNEILVKINEPLNLAATITATDTDMNSLSALLTKLTSTTNGNTCSYDISGKLIPSLNSTGCTTTNSPNSQTYNCNGQQIPTNQQCQQDQNQQNRVTTCNTDYYTGRQTCQTQSASQARQQAQEQQANQNQNLGQGLGEALAKLFKRDSQSDTPFSTEKNPNRTTTPNSPQNTLDNSIKNSNPTPTPDPTPSPAPTPTPAPKPDLDLDKPGFFAACPNTVKKSSSSYIWLCYEPKCGWHNIRNSGALYTTTYIAEKTYLYAFNKNLDGTVGISPLSKARDSGVKNISVCVAEDSAKCTGDKVARLKGKLYIENSPNSLDKEFVKNDCPDANTPVPATSPTPVPPTKPAFDFNIYGI